MALRISILALTCVALLWPTTSSTHAAPTLDFDATMTELGLESRGLNCWTIPYRGRDVTYVRVAAWSKGRPLTRGAVKAATRKVRDAVLCLGFQNVAHCELAVYGPFGSKRTVEQGMSTGRRQEPGRNGLSVNTVTDTYLDEKKSVSWYARAVCYRPFEFDNKTKNKRGAGRDAPSGFKRFLKWKTRAWWSDAGLTKTRKDREIVYYPSEIK